MSEHSTRTGIQRLERVHPVVDPGLSTEARDRLRRKLGIPGDWNPEDTLGSGFVLSLFLAILFLSLHFAIGLGWWWMIIAAFPFPISSGVALTTVLKKRLRSDDRSHFIDTSLLDKPTRELMFRTQEAIRGALGSAVYTEKSLHHAVEEPVLRRHEWDVATALRKISSLRAELDASSKDSSSGPRTSAVLNSQRNALKVATEATTSRISALERYAKELKMADAAERDWQAAMKASGRNDQYIDLIAQTAADEQAIAEIKGLTEHAAVAAQALDEHLYQASLAAQALVFPTTSQGSGEVSGTQLMPPSS